MVGCSPVIGSSKRVLPSTHDEHPAKPVNRFFRQSPIISLRISSVHGFHVTVLILPSQLNAKSIARFKNTNRSSGVTSLPSPFLTPCENIHKLHDNSLAPSGNSIPPTTNPFVAAMPTTTLNIH